MKTALKVFFVALVVIIIGGVFMVKGCLSAINSTEADTKAFFQSVIDEGSQVAYDKTSDYFKEATTFEDFDAFVQSSGVLDYVDFQSTGYEVSTYDGVATKTINGTMMFNDGTSIDMYCDWVQVGEEWKVLGFGGTVVE
ncbi:MAG: hypothetical protein ACD_51C00061G0002 [uncultured bacterium]|nr:MAG: hypothetical protein ACD_51C00061G0002 [uncultured bacterium]OGJ47773.1 MAG: hypothetical protein A2244_03970 [Candidatus Peregrinibacteria bacterium RIFOXYA2_FULL_41_18]OGJ52918.1 MAG: hypothetical protein A2336_04915 [Candidatus Peregrinibacteria bacterium RIFOXYB2_FULL_41_88]OGJ53545.1 MAG: hypothetical protein A2448_04490 [Candidatus Peregrinibacteria bacterium RIFOXYC2_FULL_41_22]